MLRALAKNGGDHLIGPAWFTHVGGALLQSFGPEFIVGEPVSADDGKPGELMVQTLHFTQTGSFQIKHEHFSAMPGNSGTDLVATARHVNGTNVRGKAGNQGQGSSSIALVEDYI